MSLVLKSKVCFLGHFLVWVSNVNSALSLQQLAFLQTFCSFAPFNYTPKPAYGDFNWPYRLHRRLKTAMVIRIPCSESEEKNEILVE